MEAGTERAAAHPGRLSVFGLTDRMQIPLLLPTRFEDLTRVHERLATAPRGERTVYRLVVAAPPQARFDGAGPRLAVSLADVDGESVRGVLYGPPDELKALFPADAPVTLVGTLKGNDQGLLLGIAEVVSPEWAGAIRPVYPSAGKAITADQTREAVLSALPSQRAAAANHIRQALAFVGDIGPLLASLGCEGWSIEMLLEASHRPTTLRHGTHAHTTLERMAALAGVRAASLASAGRETPRHFTFASMRARLAQLPHALTTDQRAALTTIYAAMRKAVPARVLLNGDTGTGKTLCFGAVAATVVDEGGRVAILVPSTVLAEQIARELTAYWPDLVIHVVTGETETPPASARLLVGTTALLHQDVGRFDVCIVDEQQKFAVQQREQYAGPRTHLIEASATCIPRTLALAHLGIADIAELREPHTPKQITTTFYTQSERAALGKAIRATIDDGDQVLIVYPERDAMDPDGDAPPDATPPVSVTEALEIWERAFPRRVRGLTGAASAEEKAKALADLRNGEADVLVATTVVEVGVNLPRLRRVVVVHPERHGLSTLHQIRGRAARTGGKGWFDLYCPEVIAPKSMRRMDILLATSDGFEVAERDLELRGFGNLAADSAKQSGADNHLIYNRPLRPEAVKAILPIWAALSGCTPAK